MNDPAPCECPNAGWCARHRMVKVRAQHQHCQKRADYRALWDERAAERSEERPEHAAEPSRFVQAGVGDLLAAGFKRLGFKPCGGCNGRREVLNGLSIPVPVGWAPQKLTAWLDAPPPPSWGVPDARWAVAVTSAPRAVATLVRSLWSLHAAGWTDVRVFAEPGSTIPRWPGVTVHEADKGVFQNWRHALSTLRDEKPDAEFYAVFQDDVLYARNLKAFLEADLWFGGDVGFVSPYRSAGKEIDGRWQPADLYIERREQRRERAKDGSGLWGALTYVFPRASVDILLADAALKTRERMIDLAVHKVLAAHGRRAWYYRPSLAEHMEGPSSVGHNNGKGMNSGGEFPGEGFDCLSLLEATA